MATVTNPGSFMATITHPTGNGYCWDRILRDRPTVHHVGVVAHIQIPSVGLQISNWEWEQDPALFVT